MATARFRDLATDLKARIKRAEELEAKIEKKLEAAQELSDQNRAVKGELAMLRGMLGQVIKPAKMTEEEKELPPAE